MDGQSLLVTSSRWTGSPCWSHPPGGRAVPAGHILQVDGQSLLVTSSRWTGSPCWSHPPGGRAVPAGHSPRWTGGPCWSHPPGGRAVPAGHILQVDGQSLLVTRFRWTGGPCWSQGSGGWAVPAGHILQVDGQSLLVTSSRWTGSPCSCRVKSGHSPRWTGGPCWSHPPGGQAVLAGHIPQVDWQSILVTSSRWTGGPCRVKSATRPTLSVQVEPSRGLRETGRMFVGCLTSLQHASVSEGRMCSNNFTCCHTKIEVANPTFYLTQSQYTDTRPTSPSADPVTPGAWQGSHRNTNV